MPINLDYIAVLDKLSRAGWKSNYNDDLLRGALTSGAAVAHWHHQAVASDTWAINHAKGNRILVCLVVDTSGFEIEPRRVQIVDDNNVQILFSAARAGDAYLIFGLFSSPAPPPPSSDVYAWDGVGGPVVIGDFVYQTTTDDTVGLALALNMTRMPAIGAVCSIPTVGYVQVKFTGKQGGFAGLVAGDPQFISDVTPGKISNVEPSLIGRVIQEVGEAASPTLVTIAIKQHRIIT